VVHLNLRPHAFLLPTATPLEPHQLRLGSFTFARSVSSADDAVPTSYFHLPPELFCIFAW
jgi:hypothetical protein